MRELQASRRAFTVTELLVVIGIIALLVTIVVVGAQKVVNLSRVSKDLSQQRGIASAQSAYASDSNDAFASNRTQGFVRDADVSFAVSGSTILLNNGNPNADRYHCWVRAYGDNLSNVPGQGQTETESALTSGVLFPYIGSVGSYRSPSDPTQRLRSYSLNGFVGTTVPRDEQAYIARWASWVSCSSIAVADLNTTKRSRIPKPSQTIMSIIADDTAFSGQSGRYYNEDGWIVDPRAPADTADMACVADSWQGWIDWPAFWDSKTITYSYVDGSTESYQMLNPEVERAILGPPSGAGHNYAQPADNERSGYREDWMHFRERLLPGVIPPIINRSLIPQS